MKIYDYKSWVIVAFLLLSHVSCFMKKRRLCIEYKKENYLVNGEHLATLHEDDEHKCMVNCVRDSHCMAFNYHAEGKTCILMPEVVGCMVPKSHNHTSYLFVHLQPCKSRPVWFSVRPAERGWYWVTTEDPRNHADTVKLPGTKIRCVSRILYQGYYLPGWWLPNGFRAVNPVTPQVMKCPYGEFLAFSDPSSYRWTPYTAGDPLPYCALPVSQLPDGTPLYVVSHEELALKVAGFYNHVKKSTYFVQSVVVNHRSVDILCGTGM